MTRKEALQELLVKVKAVEYETDECYARALLIATIEALVEMEDIE